MSSLKAHTRESIVTGEGGREGEGGDGGTGREWSKQADTRSYIHTTC